MSGKNMFDAGVLRVEFYQVQEALEGVRAVTEGRAAFRRGVPVQDLRTLVRRQQELTHRIALCDWTSERLAG